MLKFLSLALIVLSPLAYGAGELCSPQGELSSNISQLSEITSLATSGESGKASFCEIHQNKDKLVEMLLQEKNHLSFVNSGGLLGLNTGVCWWHSRMQRRMAYLADFRPDLPKPSDKEVKKIISRIKRGKKVVTVPGYSNLGEFSREHAQKFQKSLNSWILGDSVIRQRWILGLKGRSHLTPEKMKSHMEKVYTEFQQTDGLEVQVLQMPGAMAHAWLLVGMKKINDDNYEVDMIDSNEPRLVIRYSVVPSTGNMLPTEKAKKISIGSESARDLSINGYYDHFVTYTQFRNELKTLKKAVARYCSNDGEKTVSIEKPNEDQMIENNEEELRKT